MRRLDWLVTKRLLARVGLVVGVLFGLVLLVESFDSGRWVRLSEAFGPGTAFMAVAASATRWVIRTLPVSVLLGCIMGLLDLKTYSELIIANAAGNSVWRVLRGPALALLLLGLLISFGVETVVTDLNRRYNPAPAIAGAAFWSGGDVWLGQRGDGQRYVLTGKAISADSPVLSEVTAYLTSDPDATRLLAATAELRAGQWTLSDVTRLRADAPPQYLSALDLPTTTTRADLRVLLGSGEELSLPELLQALRSQLSDPGTRAAVINRATRLLTLPLLLVGSLLIAFAFTAGYRRRGDYGAMVLYGILLGFGVFVATAMADWAGSAGVLDPAFAAWGPAAAAIVAGVTVLLYREDGRA